MWIGRSLACHDIVTKLPTHDTPPVYDIITLSPTHQKPNSHSQSALHAYLFEPFSTRNKTRADHPPTETETDHEKHKQDSLHKQKQGKGHWKPELASDSEEAVKADRNTEGVDPKTLAERTKKAAEETSKAGTSMRDGL